MPNRIRNRKALNDPVQICAQKTGYKNTPCTHEKKSEIIMAYGYRSFRKLILKYRLVLYQAQQ